jgi:hypothetical protein
VEQNTHSQTSAKTQYCCQEADGADDTYTASIVESRPLVQKLTALPELLQKQQEQKTNKKSWYLVGKIIITYHYTQEDHNQI